MLIKEHIEGKAMWLLSEHCYISKNLKDDLCDLVMFTNQPAITCSKLTIATLEQGVKYFQTTLDLSFWCVYRAYEHISHLVLVFLVLTLNKCWVGMIKLMGLGLSGWNSWHLTQGWLLPWLQVTNFTLQKQLPGGVL